MLILRCGDIHRVAAGTPPNTTLRGKVVEGEVNPLPPGGPYLLDILTNKSGTTKVPFGGVEGRIDRQDQPLGSLFHRHDQDIIVIL